MPKNSCSKLLVYAVDLKHSGIGSCRKRGMHFGIYTARESNAGRELTDCRGSHEGKWSGEGRPSIGSFMQVI
jgi:hypothetical protein